MAPMSRSLLPGEFLINQSVKWRPEIRQLVCAVLGLDDESNPDRVLGSLLGEENLTYLAAKLGCQPDQVFQEIRNRLGGNLGLQLKQRRSPLPPDDISILLDEAALALISKVLGCPSSTPEVLNALFDTGQFREVLESIDVAEPGSQLDFHTLFWRAMNPINRRKLRGQYATDDIWTVLDLFVDDEAGRKLCGELGCERHEMFAAIAGRIESEEPSPQELEKPSAEPAGLSPSEDNPRLDMPAVAVIREHLRTFEDSFMEVARAVAQRLADNPTCERSLRLVHALLQYFGDHAYRKALESAVEDKQTIGDLVSETVGPDRGLGPYSIQKFEAGIELHAELHEEVGQTTVHVWFRRGGSADWETLLQFRGLGSGRSRHIVEHLPRRSEALAGTGDELVQRVLRHTIPTFQTLERKAWKLMAEDDPALVQYFALSSALHLPDPYEIREACGGSPETDAKVSHHARLQAPTRDAVYRRLQKQYERQPETPNDR